MSTTTNPTFEQMIETLTTLLTEFNTDMGEELVDAKSIIRKIKLTGVGTKAERLVKMTPKQLQDCDVPAAIADEFVEKYGIKPDVQTPAAPQMPAFPSEVKFTNADDVENYSAAKVVAEYDVNNPTNKVGTRLLSMSEGKDILVFQDDDKSLDRDATFIVLQEVLDNEYDRKDYQGRDLYKVGQKPGQMVQENPLFPGRTLRSDGTCKETEGKWKKNQQGEMVAPLKTRQILYLAAKNGEVGSMDKAKAKDLIAKAHTAEGQAWIAETYNEAAKEWRRLDKEGNLPKLQVTKEGKQNTGQGGINRRLTM